MSPTPETPPLNLLQRLDLAMAGRVMSVPAQADELLQGGGDALFALPGLDAREWIAGVLGLRGFLVHPEDVEAVQKGRPCRFDTDNREYLLIGGMIRVLNRVREWGDSCRAPEGWLMVELFKELTRGVPGFRRNCLRKDVPWDSILYVDYPDSGDVAPALDRFNPDACFGDVPVRFRSMHPVRQSFRILWKFARIAPFPDFNLAMAWVAMCLFLSHSGYPMIAPTREDRELLHRIVTGPVPARVIAFEGRLVDLLESE